MLAIGDCLIPRYREICLPQIVITIWFFKDVTYISIALCEKRLKAARFLGLTDVFSTYEYAEFFAYTGMFFINLSMRENCLKGM